LKFNILVYLYHGKTLVLERINLLISDKYFEYLEVFARAIRGF